MDDEVLSICHYSDENMKDAYDETTICGAKATDFLEMPPGIPDMGLCKIHYKEIVDSGWSMENTLNVLTELIMEESEMDFNDLLSE